MRADLITCRDGLERLYEKYNRREFVAPDPLELVYCYEDPRDREVAGLVAALLAYGGVKQIVASASDALGRMGRSPGAFIREATPAQTRRSLAGFRHRWTTAHDVEALVGGIRAAVREHGSLERAFLAGYHDDDETILPALAAWVGVLRGGGGSTRRDLLACPRQGSACKRLNLFLRWMARKDDVDPGLWRGVSPGKLVVPLDVHMHRIGLSWGMTKRKTPDLQAALEVTGAFRRISPDDPVRYDFALTRAAMGGFRFQVSGVGAP